MLIVLVTEFMLISFSFHSITEINQSPYFPGFVISFGLLSNPDYSQIFQILHQKSLYQILVLDLDTLHLSLCSRVGNKKVQDSSCLQCI